jgi:nitrite reductase/ring-hydroxylating ferredoxin subunit
MPACTTGGNTVSLSFSQYPALKNSGGSAQIQPSGYSDPVCGQNNIIVVHTSAGTYAALSSACTHACCVVSFNGTSLHCPCHGATFDVTTGKCTNGRAGQSLQVLQTCADANGVYVTT